MWQLQLAAVAAAVAVPAAAQQMHGGGRAPADAAQQPPAPVGARANWTTLPVMYMSGSREKRSDAEIEVLARFDIVCVNKMEGLAEASCKGAQEQCQIETLRRVKSANPAVFTMSCAATPPGFARALAAAP